MKVVFYSEQCDYCKKLLAYLDKYNIRTLFKLINIDKTQAPKEIDIVPTIGSLAIEPMQSQLV